MTGSTRYGIAVVHRRSTARRPGPERQPDHRQPRHPERHRGPRAGRRQRGRELLRGQHGRRPRPGGPAPAAAPRRATAARRSRRRSSGRRRSCSPACRRRPSYTDDAGARRAADDAGRADASPAGADGLPMVVLDRRRLGSRWPSLGLVAARADRRSRRPLAAPAAVRGAVPRPTAQPIAWLNWPQISSGRQARGSPRIIRGADHAAGSRPRPSRARPSAFSCEQPDANPPVGPGAPRAGRVTIASAASAERATVAPPPHGARMTKPVDGAVAVDGDPRGLGRREPGDRVARDPRRCPRGRARSSRRGRRLERHGRRIGRRRRPRRAGPAPRGSGTGSGPRSPSARTAGGPRSSRRARASGSRPPRAGR